MKANQNLWGARFESSPAEILQEFNASIAYDYKLYQYDIQGSLVHAEMLAKQNIISKEEFEQISTGLKEIAIEISQDPESWAKANLINEDVHLAIESRLTELIGDSAKKLHTARSRNDQVITDLRLFLRAEAQSTINFLNQLRRTLITKAQKDIDIILPGYTHLQQAQPISLGHYWLAYEAKFARDSERLEDSLKRININPLGSGALAGSTFKIDREFTTKKLGFTRPSENSLDAVSDRDFVLDYEFCLATISLHLSGLAEEMIIWNSQEYSFISIADSFATGSSMMPQKKNPDIPELIRGKAGRVIGTLNSLMITLKGLPLAYNKDLQEDKELLFMANDTTQKCINITNQFLQNIEANKDRMYKACLQSYTAATDAADYLVRKGIAFRDAYKIIGQLVKHASSSSKYLCDLTLAEWQECSNKFDKDILELIKPESCVDARDIIGGTARKRVKEAIKFAEARLKQDAN